VPRSQRIIRYRFAPERPTLADDARQSGNVGMVKRTHQQRPGGQAISVEVTCYNDPTASIEAA
jgi:hypothetical protein